MPQAHPQAHPVPFIPTPRAGPITDTALEEIIQIGDDAQRREEIDPATLSLMILTWPQIAREALQRRRAMGVIADMAELDNVIFMPASTHDG